MKGETRAILGELRQSFESLYGDRLARLILFGSQARGDATPSSDIDVMVVLRETVDASREAKQAGDLKAALCLKHDVVITSLYVSEDRYRAEESPLLMNVRREGVAF